MAAKRTQKERVASYIGAGIVSPIGGGGGGGSAPTNSVAPSISGTATAGQTLTASDGTWTGSPTLTRQWKADGVALSGQTGSTLLLDSSHVGKSITVTVTGTNVNGSASATSAAVGPVASAPVSAPTNSVAPSISGTPTSGQTLTANDGTWTGSPTFTRQWKADGVALAGKTASTLLLDDTMLGKTITLTVTGTNAGGSASVTSSGVGPVASNIPFTADASTFWWDFTNSLNTIDSIGGTDTISVVPERVNGVNYLQQSNKGLQPLKTANGANFNQTTNRAMVFGPSPKITNGKSGYYVAAVINANTTNGYILEIARNASSTASRCQLYFSGSRNIVLKFAAADGGTLTQVFASTALTLGAKYAIEVLVDLTTGTASLWINGVSQTVTSTGLTAAPMPSSNPSQVTVGNSAAGNLSFDGYIKDLVFYDGVPSGTIRSSIGTWLQTR